MGYFSILAAIPGFFLSSLILMLLWGVILPKFGVATRIDYPMAMLITITLWLAVAPLTAAGRMGPIKGLSAIPGFFLSSFIFMLLWGVIAPKLGAVTIGYPMAMLITITLWLVVGPLAMVGRGKWK